MESLESRRMLTVAAVATLPDVSLAAGTTAQQTVDLGAHFSDPAVPTHTVFLNTNFGSIPVQLTPDVTPGTVTNFLRYVESGRYNDTIFHRSVPNFVIQGGGFQAVANLTSVPTFGTIANEYSADRLNTRGTIAMAKSAHPDSASSQFFFNLKDNSSSLNNTANSGGFTTFGTVIGNGMAVVDAIANVPVAYNFMNPPFDELPLIGYTPGDPSAQLSQLVVIRSATSGAAYAVTSDNPAAVTAAVRGDELVYTPVASGTATITVTAAGLDGQVVTRTFKVTVGATTPAPTGEPPATDPPPTTTPPTSEVPPGSVDEPPVVEEPAASVKIGKGGKKSVSFRDEDGTTATFTISGPGSVTVYLGGTGVETKDVRGAVTVTGDSLHVMELVMAGTNGSTVVTITTKGGNKSVDVDAMTAPGALGTFDGRGVNLLGTTTIGGAVKSLAVKSAGFDSSITARSIGTMSISGPFSGMLRTSRVGSLSAGTIADAMIVTTAGGTSLGAVAAKTITNSQIRSAGNIASLVVAKGMTSSQVFAGVLVDSKVTPDSAAAGKGQILSARIGSGKKGNAFAGSTIAARTIRSITFGNLSDTLDAAAGVDLYGLRADVISGATGFIGGKAFSLKNVTNQAQADQQLGKSKPKNLKIVVS